MSESALIGIDLGKHTVRLHGQDKSGREVFRKKCSRAQMMQFFGNMPRCVVVMEASRSSMLLVAPQTESRQTLSVLHRRRETLVHERTKTANHSNLVA